ncbi:MAG: DUF1553 domain-containing protein [Planctomycetia bacterium]|nr:DUF1553 domain-containing protein [Planctomycetia bacterium]
MLITQAVLLFLSADLTTLGTDTPRSPRKDHPYHFVNDIIPLLSRHSCNGSGCHGKAEGQNGFKLSVFGFDPEADYRSLIMEGRGRRILPSAPEMSLLLRKMSGELPHGGGAKLRRGTVGYETFRAWIAVGAPFGDRNAPTVVAVKVEPREAILQPGTSQAIRVSATFSDGRTLDVTPLTRFATNNEALAVVDVDGRVTAGRVPGAAAIMANFMNVYDVFHVLVPRTQRLADKTDFPAVNVVDRLVNVRLKKLNLIPSDICDDGTFLRRVSLDLVGLPPTSEEARAFLADKDENKRAKVVEALMRRGEFADLMAMRWADLLRVDRAGAGAKQARAYHAWIREQFANNTPLDVFARTIVTVEGPVAESPAGAFYRSVKKPGEQAGAIAQVFLGVRIACAECHHHPFDRWGQDDYHSFSAYFNNVRLSAGDVVEASGLAQSTQPRTGLRINARPLTGPIVREAAEGDQRGKLAVWLTASDNPWFARNIANRVWAQLMGRGLIEPVDDIRDTNPPSNPELLDALARHLVENKYDVRSLVRLIAASRAYQRSTTPNETNAMDGQNYSRGLMRRLSAEVLLDTISQTMGVQERFKGASPGVRAVQLWDNKVDHYFLKAFGRPERSGSCECERNMEPAVAQVLHLLNSPEIEAKIGHASGTVARIVKRHKDDSTAVEELYLTVLGRMPTTDEKRTASVHLQAAESRRRAYEDLAWALLNTLEFAFNH